MLGVAVLLGGLLGRKLVLKKKVLQESMQKCVAVTLKQRTGLTGQVGESLGAFGISDQR